MHELPALRGCLPKRRTHDAGRASRGGFVQVRRVRTMRHPERYGQLFVRVGGFSARFVELERAVQPEILHRTLY